MSYYAYTSWHYYHQTGFQLNFIVPSGNLGNVTACFWAKKAGFPINRIYISQNDNDTLLQYLQTGNDPSQTSQATLANAMDVGKPSNFERLKHLFKDFETFKNNVEVVAASDEKIKQAVYEVYKHYNYLMCPHTATTYHANKTFNAHHVAYVATAHPAKFDHIIKNILDREIEAPQQLEKLLNAPDHSKSINPDMNELINIFKMLQS
jgi:threonine synthase